MQSETRKGWFDRSPVGVRGLLVLALAGLLLWLGSATGPASGDTGSAGVTCYALTRTVGSGSGTLLAMPSSSGSCPNGHYTAGYTATVVATAAGGYMWTGWSGTDDNSANPTSVAMNSDRTATAYFTWNCYQLTLNVGGGSGTVQAMPASAGGCPNGQYPAGYTVAVVAMASPGSQFSSWSGTDNNGNSSTTVTMNGNRTASAYFTANCYHLTLNVGSGSGTVQAFPTSAGGCPNGQYPAGYQVAVVATASSGSQFSSWSGTDNNSNSSTTVTMNGDKTATAYFASNCYHLTLNVGSGSGTVQAFPTSAGGCPNGQYPLGYMVAVVATASSGSQFSQWTGTDNNSNSSTTVTMNGDRTATAYFASNCYHLTLNVGSGNGTVLPFPTSAGGCPNGQYPSGYMVAVVATAGGGYQFSLWSGTDNNSNSSTTVTMGGDRTATAFFVVPGGTVPPTPVPTSTPTRTPTPTPTRTPTLTFTPQPTGTATDTPTPGTPTDTPLPGSETDTPTQTPTSTWTPLPPTPAYPRGDANCSGVVDAIDATLVLQFAAGMFHSVPCPQAADVNGSGHIDAIDAAIILQIAAGLLAGG